MYSLSYTQNEHHTKISQGRTVQHRRGAKKNNVKTPEQLVDNCIKNNKAACSHNDCMIREATKILLGKAVTLYKGTLLEKLTHRLWYNDNIPLHSQEFITVTLLRAKTLVTIYQINFFNPSKTFTKKGLKEECRMIATKMNNFIFNSDKYTCKIKNECSYYYLLLSTAFVRRKISKIKKDLDKLYNDLDTPFYIKNMIFGFYSNQSAPEKTSLFYDISISEKPKIDALVNSVRYLILLITSLKTDPCTKKVESGKLLCETALHSDDYQDALLYANIKHLEIEMKQIYEIIKVDYTVNICRRFSKSHLEFLKKLFEKNSKISQLFLIGESNIKIQSFSKSGKN
jgi:hypothetical protein